MRTFDKVFMCVLSGVMVAVAMAVVFIPPPEGRYEFTMRNKSGAEWTHVVDDKGLRGPERLLGLITLNNTDPRASRIVGIKHCVKSSVRYTGCSDMSFLVQVE